MSSFGVQLFEVSFDRIVAILAEYGVAFDWPERDAGQQPKEAWEKYSRLGESDRWQISKELVSDIQEDLIEAVTYVLDTDISTLPRRISSVEVLMKTEQDEIVLATFGSVADALQHLMGYITDSPDIGDLPDFFRRDMRPMKRKPRAHTIACEDVTSDSPRYLTAPPKFANLN